MQGERLDLLAVIVPDLGQVLVLFSSHLVHCLIVQRHNLVQDLGIVAGNVGTHHGRRLQQKVSHICFGRQWSCLFITTTSVMLQSTCLPLCAGQM